jgi:hypothetical protein
VDVDKNYEPIDTTRLGVLKLQMGWSLPDFFEVGSVAIIPSYVLTNWQSVKTDLIQEGSQHEFGLTAVVPITLWDTQALSIKGTANYHDGLLGIKEGWTHYTLEANTTFAWKGLFIKPGLNYQWSEEPTLNPEDEFWGSLSFTKLF